MSAPHKVSLDLFKIFWNSLVSTQMYSGPWEFTVILMCCSSTKEQVTYLQVLMFNLQNKVLSKHIQFCLQYFYSLDSAEALFEN